MGPQQKSDTKCRRPNLTTDGLTGGNTDGRNDRRTGAERAVNGCISRDKNRIFYKPTSARVLLGSNCTMQGNKKRAGGKRIESYVVEKTSPSQPLSQQFKALKPAGTRDGADPASKRTRQGSRSWRQPRQTRRHILIQDERSIIQSSRFWSLNEESIKPKMMTRSGLFVSLFLFLFDQGETMGQTEIKSVRQVDGIRHDDRDSH
jgi:hypothetical protein